MIFYTHINVTTFAKIDILIHKPGEKLLTNDHDENKLLKLGALSLPFVLARNSWNEGYLANVGFGIAIRF